MLLVDQQEQRAILVRLEALLAKRCDSKISNWSKDEIGYQVGNFVIWIYPRESKWVGLAIRNVADSSSERDLQFTTYSPRSGVGAVAAAFIDDGKKIILGHDARVYTRDGRAKPYSDQQIEVGKKLYFVVSDRLDADDFIDDIISFQESRRNPYLSDQKGIDESGGGTGIDLGSKNGGIRRGGSFAARHSPIVAALWKQLEASGYKLAKTSVLRPDILVAKGNSRLLFEIKADATFNSICAAIGQVVCYAADCNPTHKFIVSSALDESSPYASVLLKVMKDQGIFHLPYVTDGKIYSFSNLPQ